MAYCIFFTFFILANIKEVFTLPKFLIRSSGIFVPSYFIENFMPQANGTFLKVYLYTLDLAYNDKTMDNASIAKALSILESDVIQAYTYWFKEGLLTINDGIVEFSESPVPPKTEQPQAPPAYTPPAQPQTYSHHQNNIHSANTKSYTAGQVSAAIAQNKSLADMCTLAQNVLGKTLSSKDVQTLYWFYDGLGFSPEIILMLLEYCVSKEKRNMNYIEKVAISWRDKGLVTMDTVDKHIKDEHERYGYVYSLRKVLGILDRPLSQLEDKFLTKWRYSYNMTEEMVALAYEHCIIQTAKLSFPYMDKILLRWKENGIHTVLEAERDNQSFKQGQQSTHQKQTATFNVNNDNFNHDELEKIVWENLNNK